MSVKAFLQGKWLGHPLHPAIVHVPTGLWPAALVFDLLSRAGVGGNAMVRTSFYCVLAGTLAALAAVPPGLADWSEIKPGRPARMLGIYHMVLNVVALLLFAASLLLRWRDALHADVIPIDPLVLTALGTAVLAVSGYLGGRMVFDQGVGVARFSKKKWRRLAEDGRANVPAE